MIYKYLITTYSYIHPIASMLLVDIIKCEKKCHVINEKDVKIHAFFTSNTFFYPASVLLNFFMN